MLQMCELEICSACGGCHGKLEVFTGVRGDRIKDHRIHALDNGCFLKFSNRDVKLQVYI